MRSGEVVVLDVQMSQAEDVVRSVLSAARMRARRLAGVTVTAPEGVVAADVEAWLKGRLSAQGLANVEVKAVTHPGPLRLMALEFTR